MKSLKHVSLCVQSAQIIHNTISNARQKRREMKYNSRESSDEENEEDEIDSDIEKEKQMNRYERVIAKDVASRGMRRMARQELKEEGKRRSTPPKASLKLHHVFGYRGYDCHSNIGLTQSGQLVFHVAAVGVVQGDQQTFYIGHTDDILCLNMHPLKDFVATGQVGKHATIHVWDASTLKPVSILSGGHNLGVSAVDFSADGKRLVSVGLDNNHMVVLWDWRKGEKLSSARGHRDRVFGIRINPTDSTQFVTVGVRHIKFWTQAGGSFTSNRGVFGELAKMDTMLCVEYGKQDNTCYSGAAGGHIYVWNKAKLVRTVQATKGPCYSIYALDMGFVTGGKDGIVSLWDDSMQNCIKTYSIDQKSLNSESGGVLVQDNPPIRAVALGRAKIIAGTKNGEIVEIDKDGTTRIITQGHMEGELWGLAVDQNNKTFITVGDDKWLFINSPDKTLAAHKLKSSARSVAISPDSKLVAIGFKDGSLSIHQLADFSEKFSIHHRKENISDVKFSPDGHYLAAASHDNFIDIYDMSNGKRTGICRGHSSYVTHFDWSHNGNLIQSNSGAKEHLFFESPKGTRQPAEGSIIDKTVKWDTWTGVLGPSCLGIWPPKCDITDVNATSLHPKQPLLATADDFGFVKLFRYPARTKYAKCKSYSGHSAHVTNIRWVANGEYLVSTGGADTSVLVWKYEENAGGQSENDDTDSDEDAGYDSDVEREKNIDYTSKMYAEPLRARLGQIDLKGGKITNRPLVSRRVGQKVPVVRLDPNTLPQLPKGKKRVTDIKSLRLEYVFGYRGFDCTNNSHYLPNSNAIVFHAAGTGIIQELATGEQRFYTEHTDDILCVAVCQAPKHSNIVATAQIDLHAPTVHLWNTNNMQPVSKLLMNHEKGVNCVDFSGTGKLLVTVGMDKEHTISVWKWADGTLVGSSHGHTHKICDIQFRPDSDSHFVSVGIKHVKFWKICGSELVSQKGVIKLENAKMYTMLSIAFAPDSITYTGSVTGDVYVWHDETLQRVVQGAHDGPIFSMFTSLQDGLIVTGGKQKKDKDGACVKLWDQKMTKSRPFPLRSMAESKSLIVKSVSRQNKRILVGSQNCDLLEIDESSGEAHILLHSHGDGELWGLAAHPNSLIAATASYDKTLRLWNIEKKMMVAKILVEEQGSVVDFNGDGSILCVGMKNGTISLFHVADLKCIITKRDRNSCVNAIKFSTDGKTMAVGYNESITDVYDVTKPESISRVNSLKALQKPITHMDFSADGKYLKVCSVEHEVRIFELPAGHEINNKTVLSKIIWKSWNDISSPEVHGIWPDDGEIGDVNAVDLSHIGNTLVSGDDAGMVKLYEFPATQKNSPCLKFHGHSAHVTNVKFTYDDSYLLSTGGDDTCLFVWKCE